MTLPTLLLSVLSYTGKQGSSVCVCLHSGMKSFLLLLYSYRCSHASFYLRTTIFQDKNNGFLECKKLQEVVIRKGARG